MQASGVMRRENATSYLRRMGRAKRNPSPSASAPALMGIAEPVIGRAFARPVGSTHPTRPPERIIFGHDAPDFLR